MNRFSVSTAKQKEEKKSEKREPTRIRPPAYGIIPARYASSRFPGKPLADILGKPMFWHVWSRACLCPFLRGVTLATDDKRIARAAAALSVPCVMTGADHVSGTDRVYEAARLLGVPEHAIVINIQGDEPLLEPDSLSMAVQAFADPEVRIATLAHPIGAAEAARPDKVKVVRAANGDALYFSRSPIPHICGEAETNTPRLGHIGLYAFSMSALRQFVNLPPSSLELTERLEQLRFLENNIPVRVVVTDRAARGVDTPEDLKEVIALLKKE